MSTKKPKASKLPADPSNAQVAKKEYSPKVKQIVADAKAFAEEKKAELTKEDFAQALAQFFEESKVMMNPRPAGNWLANAHLDKLNNPQDRSLISTYDLGPPKASRKYTTQQLLDIGYCGLYMKQT